MPDVVNNAATMFADDTKVHSQIMTNQDCEKLQEDLNNLAA